MSKEPRAFTLYSVLLISAFCSALIACSFYIAQTIIKERFSEIEARVATRKVIFQSLDNIDLQTSSQSARLNCIRQEAQYGRSQISRELCSLKDLGLEQALISGNALSNKELFPQFDYNLIFKDAPLKTNLEYKVVGDLVLNTDLNIPNLPNDNVYLLATTGSLKISGKISASSNLLMIAGTDVEISDLSSTGPMLDATIVSAAGSALIGFVSSEIKLNIIAFKDIVVPNGIANQNNQVRPPRLLQEVLGIIY